ncbi:MAG: NAD(+)/NADH kinase [Lachnospiraceae bacterium]|nr:NAD(+)/NADH kinase [Lachnospiraceae bacterium]
MKVLICVNPYKDKDLSVCKKICSFFDEKGVSYAKPVLVSKEANIKDEDVEGCDVALVLGGDGTLMRTAKKCSKYNISILGINLGHLGFLAQTGTEGLENTLLRLIAGEYTLEERMLVTGSIFRNGEKIFEREALNDVCINRGGQLQILNYEISVNGMFLKAYAADGVIISTPTGSTGYNLSAGGPIVEPSADMILVTPIAAHSFMNRSILFKAEDSVKITIGEPHDEEVGQTVIVHFDGFDKLDLLSKDEIVITKNDRHVSFIQMNNINFLETLNRKLREN